MKKEITEQQKKELQKPLPIEAVKPHPTKTYLSSIKAIYVVERLNQVFGIGSWHLKSEVIDNKTDMIVVRSVLTIPEYGIELESFGGNDNGGENSKNFDLGDAYKGATTDAFTKICSYLEIGIDVYKGKGDKAPLQNISKPQEDNKPWMTETQFNVCLRRINDGEQDVYKKANETFRMKKDYREKLIDASQKKELA